MIVDDDAGDIHQEAAALGADAIEGQQRQFPRHITQRFSGYGVNGVELL